jgi:lipid A 3-O-deacylase
MRFPAMVAAISVALVGAARAGAIDSLHVGVLAHDVGPISSGREGGAAVNVEAQFRSPRALMPLLYPRPMIGGTLALDGAATSELYAGLAWRQDFGSRLFASASAAIAVHDGDTNYEAGEPLDGDFAFLGCRALFRFSGEVGAMATERASISIYYSHASNAGLCAENEGLDNLGARLGYKF